MSGKEKQMGGKRAPSAFGTSPKYDNEALTKDGVIFMSYLGEDGWGRVAAGVTVRYWGGIGCVVAECVR